MSINQVAEKIETQETEAKAQIYQAIGVVTGVLNISNSKKPTLLIEERTYPVSVAPRAFWKHEPGEIKSFLAYPSITDGKLGFILLWVKSQVPETHIFTLKGCWEEEENQAHLKIYRNQISSDGNFTPLSLTWDNCPSADGQYWEIEAELRGDSFHVISAIGPFDPPQKHLKQIKKAESDLPPPTLKGDRTKAIKSDAPPSTMKSAEPKAIKSDLPPPTLKSAKASIAALEPMAIEPPESEVIVETARELIALNTSQAIAETTITAKAADVIEPIASSEVKAAHASKESIAPLAPKAIEPEETEASPVVVEAVTPKKKKGVSKSPASKKSSISPETAEPKKTKEKVKSSGLKKSMSLAADGSAGAKGDRLFLGKQLPPGK
jgi:hypothetical protein